MRGDAPTTPARGRTTSAPTSGRGVLWRAVIAVVVVALSVWVALTTPITLGLDMRGGTQVTLQAQSTSAVTVDSEVTDRVAEILERRVNALGVAETTVVRQGDDRIVVELPGVEDPREAADALGRTAQLTFHAVSSSDGAVDPSKEPPAFDPVKGGQLPTAEGELITVGPAVITGEEVGDATGGIPPGSPAASVQVSFKGEGQDAWVKLTGEAACSPAGDPMRRVAIVLDGTAITSPQVDPSVNCGVGILGGSTEITGQFTLTEAQELAALINGGALPVPVEIIEQRVLGPTLGEEAISASVKAGLIGILLTGIFIVVIYRLVGLLASIALGCYALISYAVLAALGSVLTLPGIAGFVLAIGMAIDANVLVFERAREEYARGLTVDKAADAGFSKAFSAIIDSNVTTLIAAALLFFYASGPVKGFGVTLSVGVIASMVSALIITRVLVDLLVRRAWVKRRPQVSGLANEGRVRRWMEGSNADLMGRRRLWLSISTILVVLSIAGIAVKGLNLGVEFTGGRQVDYAVAGSISVEQTRDLLAEQGINDVVVQQTDGQDISIRGELSNDQVIAVDGALADATGGRAERTRDELIGPSLGDELRRNALIALGIALVLQLAYLAFRFRWTFGAGAVIAMFHDVLIVTGFFAWTGRLVDGVFVAAILTIVGYSVNDSVVVFDRVREEWTDDPKAGFDRSANRAILRTIPRTVNTGMGALFILGALAVLGGDTLRNFALALIIGIVIGTFSTMFTAAPLTSLLEQRSGMKPPRPKAKKQETRDPGWTGAVV